METWTIQKLLGWMNTFFEEKGLDSPRLSAEMLLSHVLSCQRIELYTNFNKAVDPGKLSKLRQLVKRASEHEPVAYLVGKQEFYSLAIEVTADCLIPRPETELLVERSIEYMRNKQCEGTQNILDLCTGSGCVAVAVAKNFPDCHITATDISSKALEIARKNIEKHDLAEKIDLLCGDLFGPVKNETFDLIVSNPPYVTTEQMQQLDRNVRDFEPHTALHAGPDGLDIFKRILNEIKNHLKPDSAVIMEMGYLQGQDVRDLFEQTGLFKKIMIEKDLPGNDRLVIGQA